MQGMRFQSLLGDLKSLGAMEQLSRQPQLQSPSMAMMEPHEVTKIQCAATETQCSQMNKY